MKEEILEFYKKTSLYTYLGLYETFAKNLPDDICKLCLLQRKQIIHPVTFNIDGIREKTESFWGDMTQIPITRLKYEDDLFPTAVSTIIELLRKDARYTEEREAKNKIHVTCRSQAILLAAILKAKGIPARVRSGFSNYIHQNGVAFDHWITEYYHTCEKRWVLVDPDMCCTPVPFNIFDIPREEFMFGAVAWTKFRKNELQKDQIYYAGYSYEKREEHHLEGLLRALFYDFHALMNDEVIFLHVPRYIVKKNFKLEEQELEELDLLASYLLDPDTNFDLLQEIWATNEKYRIMSGGLNG